MSHLSITAFLAVVILSKEMLLFFFFLQSNRLDGLEEQVKTEPVKEGIEKQKKAKTKEKIKEIEKAGKRAGRRSGDKRQIKEKKTNRDRENQRISEPRCRKAIVHASLQLKRAHE